MSDQNYMKPVDNPGVIMNSEKQFADSLTMDLTDEEIDSLLRTILPIRQKWQVRFINRFSNDPKFDVDKAMKMVDDFEDELKYEAATKHKVLLTVDVSPLLEGKSMCIDVVGALPGHTINTHGMDHERKEFEVKRAVSREEDWLGQKGNANAAKTKLRAKKK